ncbi:MAG: peptidoglycan editing factor PgeF [Candidatus Omnitrophica bacterium]|nr:peptidoglycan editing factor PgeF [Candidatus Omnitrophota bacterium]
MTVPLILQKEKGRYVLAPFGKFGVEAFFTAKPLDLAFESRGRRLALRQAGIDAGKLVCPCQIHGTRVRIAGKRDRGAGVSGRKTALQETDALVTSEKEVALSVLTADCLPVFLVDPEKRVIAIAHAGWRGLQGRILSRVLGVMAASYGSCPGDIVAGFGPAIRSCCYEVGEEFLSFFPGAARRQDRGIFMDLALGARMELEAEGVPAQRILDSGICTCCRADEFHSYRQSGPAAGRNISVLRLLV